MMYDSVKNLMRKKLNYFEEMSKGIQKEPHLPPYTPASYSARTMVILQVLEMSVSTLGLVKGSIFLPVLQNHDCQVNLQHKLYQHAGMFKKLNKFRVSGVYTVLYNSSRYTVTVK